MTDVVVTCIRSRTVVVSHAARQTLSPITVEAGGVGLVTHITYCRVTQALVAESIIYACSALNTLVPEALISSWAVVTIHTTWSTQIGVEVTITTGGVWVSWDITYPIIIAAHEVAAAVAFLRVAVPTGCVTNIT